MCVRTALGMILQFLCSSVQTANEEAAAQFENESKAKADLQGKLRDALTKVSQLQGSHKLLVSLMASI